MDLATIDYITTGDPTGVIHTIRKPFYKAIKLASRWRKVNADLIVRSINSLTGVKFTELEMQAAEAAAQAMADRIMAARAKKTRTKFYETPPLSKGNTLRSILVRLAQKREWEGVNISWAHWLDRIDFERSSSPEIIVGASLSFDGRWVRSRAIRVGQEKVETGHIYTFFSNGRWNLSEFVSERSHWG
jgi:hypothetical protein